jgi:hypothetical protein
VTAGLLVAGVVVVLMVAAGIWLMERAATEPAARAVGRAPDLAEEQLAREQASARAEGRRSILLSDPRS